MNILSITPLRYANTTSTVKMHFKGKKTGPIIYQYTNEADTLELSKNWYKAEAERNVKEMKELIKLTPKNEKGEGMVDQGDRTINFLFYGRAIVEESKDKKYYRICTYAKEDDTIFPVRIIENNIDYHFNYSNGQLERVIALNKER